MFVFKRRSIKMPNNHIQCTACTRVIRSDHLKRHMRTHDVLEGDGKDVVENDAHGSTYEFNNKSVWKINNEVRKNYSFLLLRAIRGIIVGKSGFGKTSLLNYLLLELDMLDYDTLLVCGNSLHQPEYRIMNAAFD